MEGRLTVGLLELDGFLDQHDGDIVFDAVEDATVFAEQACLDGFRNLVSAPCAKASGLDSGIQAFDDRLVRQCDRLAGFGTDQDFKKFVADGH